LLQHLYIQWKNYIGYAKSRYLGIPFGSFVNRNHFCGLGGIIDTARVGHADPEDRASATSLPTGRFCSPLFSYWSLFLSRFRGGILSLFAEIGSCNL